MMMEHMKMTQQIKQKVDMIDERLRKMEEKMMMWNQSSDFWRLIWISIVCPLGVKSTVSLIEMKEDKYPCINWNKIDLNRL